MSPFVVTGLSQIFTVEGAFADGSLQDMTNRVTWSSSVTSVTMMSEAGTVTGGAPGVSTTFAVSGNKSASTSLTE